MTTPNEQLNARGAQCNGREMPTLAKSVLPGIRKIVAAMVLATAVSGCDDNPKPGSVNLQCLPKRFELVENIKGARYVRDPKMNLCYFAVGSGNDFAITQVPCENIMPKAVTTGDSLVK
jgi:hypothetical protein